MQLACSDLSSGAVVPKPSNLNIDIDKTKNENNRIDNFGWKRVF